MSNTVTTVCYGIKREWKNREEAQAFFNEGVMSSEGSERDRYINVLIRLHEGLDYCTDED